MELSLAQIEAVRAHRWRTASGRTVHDERGALRFLREHGFVVLLPVAGAELPTLHTACGGSWGVWWDWKQTLPERRACYYAHLLRRRGTFIWWDWVPAFYAVYGPKVTYHQLYREGLLDRDEKQVLDLLADRGPLLTREVRLLFAPPSKGNTRRVKQVLVELQRRFLICAAGGTTEGWSHHRWDLVARWVPAELLFAARGLAPEEAKRRLTAQFIRNAVATTPADIAWLFGWERAEVKARITEIIAGNEAESAFVPELEGEVIVPRPWPGGRPPR